MTVLARRIVRLGLLLGATAFYLVLGITINVPLFGDGEGRARRRARATMHWARTLCLILGIRISRVGELREAPRTITVSNHVSYIDILVLGSLRPPSSSQSER